MAPPSWSQGDSYRPHYQDRGVPPPPQDAADAMYHFRGHANDRDHRSRGRLRNHPGEPKNNFTFRKASKISERPLLRKRHDDFEERVLGNEGSQEKFRDLDNLTDSEEAEMEDSEDEDERNAKRVRLEETEIKMPQPSKWSNPDPYTSLPAPSEATGKKVDFVKLIRKARQDVRKSKDSMDANVQDFISLSMNEQENSTRKSPTIPTGPASFRNQPDWFTRDPPGQNGYHPGPDAVSSAHMLSESDGHLLGKRKRDDVRGSKSDVKLMKVRGEGRYYSNAAILDKWRAKEGEDPTPWLGSAREGSPAIAFHKEILDFYDWVRPQDYEFAVRAECIDRLSTVLRRLHPGELKAFGSYGAGLFLPTGDMDLVFLDGPFLARLRRGESGLNAPLSKYQFRNWLGFIRNANIARPGSIVPIAHAKVPIIKFVDRVSGLKIDLSFNNDTGLVANETFHKWRAAYPAMPIIVSIVKQFLMMRGLNDVSTGGLGGFSTICLVTSIIQHLPGVGNPQNLGEVLLQFFNLYGNHLDRDTVAIRLDPPGYIDKQTYGPHLFNNDKKGRLTIIDPHRPENNISGGTSEIKLIAGSFSLAHNALQEQLKMYNNSGSSLSFLEPIIGGSFDTYTMQRNALYSLHCGQPGLIAPLVQPNRQNASMPDASAGYVHARPSKNDEESPVPVASVGYVRALLPQEDQVSAEYIASKDGMQGHSGPSGGHDEDSATDSSMVQDNRADHQNLLPSERRAIRFRKPGPDLADHVGGTLDAAQATRLGGYASVSQRPENPNIGGNGSNVSGLKPAQKRAVRLKALRPDIADKVGDRVNLPRALKLGGYETKKEMTKDLQRRAEQRIII